MESALNSDSTLTVFLGRGGLSHGIRQTLEDFTATGLVRDLAWVDADSFRSSSSEVTYLRLSEEGSPEITREPFNALVARSRITRLHLGVINVVGFGGGEIRSAELMALTDAIDSILTGRSIQRTNLIISAVGAPLETDLPVLKGFTNLFLAPEDSPGPESATVPFHFDHLDNRFTLHCVAGIASLFGLWEGSTHAPVARLDPASGVSFRLVRAYYRRIDGQDVQARLKARIFDTELNPLPRLNRPGQEVSAQYTENPRAFAETAAEDLLSEFNQRIEGKPTHALAQQTRRTTSGRALGEFLRIWGKRMVTTPARFFRDLRGEARTFVDDTVQVGLYGEDSRIRVGGGGDAEPDPADDSGTRQARRENLQVEATRELGPLWSSYANTALTMLDASPRFITENAGQSSYPRVMQEHPERPVWVARSAADVIPGPDANFGHDLPVEVKSTIGGGDIAPYDIAGIAAYERSLASQRHGRQRGVGRVIGDFKQWQEENSGSFACHVGRGLVERRGQLHQRKEQLTGQIADLEDRQARAAGTGALAGVLRWLGWVFMGSVMIFALIWGFGHLRPTLLDAPRAGWVDTLNAAPTDIKVWMFSIWVGLWLLFWILQVAVETRDEMRFLNRRRDIVNKLDAARANLEVTRKALVRIDVGYRQFLSTSRMIGALINEPFGYIRHPRVESTIPVNTMPESVVFAEADPASGEVERLANTFRREIYREGWLGDYVMGGLAEAARNFEERTNGKFAVNDVFSTSGEGTGGQLARLAGAVTATGFRTRDRSKDVWRRVTADLRQDTERDDTGILSPQQVYRDGRRETAPSRLPLDEAVALGSFNGEIATERGRVDGILEVDPRYCTHDRNINTFDAIGVSEVLVQIGQPAHEGDVAFRRPDHQPLDPGLVGAMPDSEDFQVREPRVMTMPQPKHHLPGTGEF
ncbi:hypothetical protein EAH68_03050 [Corynebacterium hylobatis]|uniref:Uncharacterized protein n=1 Tax=Corynebacterium hylobatis TaxID=1859290 RepID=A0A430I1R0_9CORY|nr:hypothetical protein [Corynebacterium hylobatis]RSZ65133.1 hypothetical protein EAH68_03050 [Corynebacterium hylobatis]